MEMRSPDGIAPAINSTDSGYYKLMLDTLSFIYNDKDLTSRINHILEMIGKFIDVSRAYVFEDDLEHFISVNTYEWCAAGVAPQRDALQELPHAAIAPWHDLLLGDGILQAQDIRELPDTLYRVLKAQDIHAIVALPLYDDDALIGFIGVDECRGTRCWSEREIELLRALSTLVATQIANHNMENLLRASHRRFRTVMDNIEIPIYVTDLESSRILFANKKFVEDVKQKDAEGGICWKVLRRHAEDGACPDCPREKLLALPEGACLNWEVHNALVGKWYYCTDSLIEWVDGRRAHLQSAVEITARKEYEERLMFSASCDAMTGIYNRESGLRLVKEMIEAGVRQNFVSTFCYIDLDDLKHVNDTYGHAEGDRLILTTVEAISSIVRNTDIFARLGGDEFMVTLRSCNIPNAKRVISNVQRKLEQLNRSGKFPYLVSFSVGFAEIPSDAAIDVDTILIQADKNMYMNKQAKKVN